MWPRERRPNVRACQLPSPQSWHSFPSSGSSRRSPGWPARGAATGSPKEIAMSLQLELLETSFDLIAPRGEELVDRFYARILANDEVAPLFAETDMARQKTMLLATLVLLRKSLRDLDAIVPKLRELGARHVAYGAAPEHYPVVGEVLIASLAAVAGDAWTPEYEQAWGEAFELVAAAMLE